MAAQPRRILVGFDGSDTSWRALDTAIQLTGYGSTLTVVTVAPEGQTPSVDALAAAREHVRSRQLSAAYLQRAGDPVEELLGAAREGGAELVVVGRSETGDGTPGDPASVSASVVRRAACDVLVVS